MLKNSYLCLLNNTTFVKGVKEQVVVICWKIRIFAYWTTPRLGKSITKYRLWFAEKFVSLLIEQHRQRGTGRHGSCCDLLKNSYLCLLNNTAVYIRVHPCTVVICWKIRIFAYWTTPYPPNHLHAIVLWFAEKFVSLLIEQHHEHGITMEMVSCDLLKNSYLCLLNNTWELAVPFREQVVICWKIRIFAYWTTPSRKWRNVSIQLWFAEKFVSLLIEQHHCYCGRYLERRCDLLKNSYLCLLNNTDFSTAE